MTTKGEFAPEEWRTITEAVALAGMAMIGLERGGTVRESLAMAGVYGEMQKRTGSGDLVGEIVRFAPDIESGDLTAAVARLTEAVALVRTRATSDELAGYRELVMTIATRVAEADRSGGFLRRGRPASEAERAALAQIAAAVGVG